ncbi:hypothetical protein HY489_05140 [Candidatus Woesearchaeota archaeon]|nr:hypothetical protein [Candidatus Woesearchaeota archaeon]
MLDDKKLKEIRGRVPKCVKEGKRVIDSQKKFVDFFLTNARNSLSAAKLLFEMSTSQQLQSQIGYADFNGFLWVINTSYYSMFYMARALLESNGIKIKTEIGVHAVTFDALVFYFYLTGKLQKKLIEDFAEAKTETAELLGKERAKMLIEEYYYEKEKRTTFTYELGEIAMQNKAQTSLGRAKIFNEEIRKILQK